MESESDVGGSEEDDYGKAFDMAEEDDADDVDGGNVEEDPEPSDGEYVVPIRPIRKVRGDVGGGGGAFGAGVGVGSVKPRNREKNVS